MRSHLLTTALVAAVLAMATPADAKPLSTSAQMNQLISSVCNVELGNGRYAFRSYDPATFKRGEARKLIRQDMKNFEAVNAVYARVLVGQTLPARAVVAVAGLPRGVGIEVDAFVVKQG